MDFRPGQRVRCVNEQGWVCLISGEHRAGPAYGRICTVVDIYDEPPGSDEPAFLTLAGFPADEGFTIRLFRPLDQIDDLAARIAAEAAPKRSRLLELVELLP